jgi:hypothetical protein
MGYAEIVLCVSDVSCRFAFGIVFVYLRLNKRMAQMATKLDKWPPRLSVDKAIDIAFKINGAYGNKVNKDLLPDILECSIKSSNFSKRLYAMQMLGFVTVANDVVTLTEMALSIIRPISPTEQVETKARILNFHPLLRELADRFPGGHLPDMKHLRNLLLRTYEVPEESVDEWVRFVVDSFGVLRTSYVEALPSEYARGEAETQNPASDTGSFSEAAPQNTKVISVPLKRGANRVITVPCDLNREEFDWFVKWFDVWENRPE